MSRMPMLRRVVFALGLVGALGFGATQAIADRRNATDEQPRACNPLCKPDCDGFGGELRHWGCLCCG